MVIEIVCGCGKKLTVADTMAGKKGKCPACGNPLMISKPPAPKASAPLELELEDEKPAGKPALPPEALFTPAQEIPDAAAKKKQAAQKKSHSDLMGDDPAPPKRPSRAPAVTGSNAGGVDDGKIACQQCGERYSPDTLFCMKCSIDLTTGKPLAGLMPGTARRKADGPVGYDPDKPFWKVLLEFCYKPWEVIGNFPSYFESRNMQIQMAGFYVFSFLMVAIAASSNAKKLESRAVKQVTEEERVAEIEKGQSSFELHSPKEWTPSGSNTVRTIGKPYVFRVTDTADAVEPGETFTIKLTICEPGPGKGIAGDLWGAPTETYGGGVEPFADWEQGQAKQVGDYEIVMDAQLAAGTSCVLYLYEKGADPFQDGAKALALIHLAYPSKPGWGKKILALDQEADAGFNVQKEIARREAKPGRRIVAETERRVSGDRDGMISSHEPFYWKTNNAPMFVPAGQKFAPRLYLMKEEDGKPGAPMEAKVFFTAEDPYDPEDFDDEGNGPAPPTEVLAGTTGEPGGYTGDVTAVFARETIVEAWICAPDATSARSAFARLTIVIPTAPGWAKPEVEKEKKQLEEEHAKRNPKGAVAVTKKYLVGASAVLGSILGNILEIAFASVLFTVVARLFGGGGSFMLMALTLAFIQAFVNLLSIGTIWMPWDMSLMASLGLMAFQVILRLIALMKVYELSFGLALIVNLVANVISFFVVAYIVLAVLGVAVAVSGT